MKNRWARGAAAVCAAALYVTMLAGCMGGQQTMSEEAQAQAANRQYMSQVNQIMTDLDATLTDFSSAVQAGDVVTMRSALTEASRSIDSLEELSAPEALADIQTAYTEGCTQLETALNDYVQLYTDVENAGGSMESGAYQSRLTEIQQSYDEGVQKLANADELAAGKE